MSERERWAYEELQPGDVIQPGDEWQNDNGHWHPLVVMAGACIQVRDNLRARRPHNITALQSERDESLAEVAKLSTALKSAQRARDELQRQVDELRDLVHELHGSMDEIADAGTAADVKEMLTTWATELDYSSDCFDAVGKSQLDIVQKTLITAIARIEIEFGKEVDSADA